MITEGGANAFGLSLALTNKTKTELPDDETDVAEEREVLEEMRQEQLQQEVNLMVNQIGKMNQPLG